MTQMMSTQDLAMVKGMKWVDWRGTVSRVNTIKPHPEDGSCMIVNITRYNMCGTEIGRLNVVAMNTEQWTIASVPL